MKYAEITKNTNLQLWLFSVHLSSEIVWSLQKTLLHTRAHTEYNFWVWNWINPVIFLKKYSWIYYNIFTHLLYNAKNKKKMYSSITLYISFKLKPLLFLEGRQGSSVNAVTRLWAGWSGDSRWVQRFIFSTTIHTGSAAHPVSCLMGTSGSLPKYKVVRAWSWPLTSILCQFSQSYLASLYYQVSYFIQFILD